MRCFFISASLYCCFPCLAFFRHKTSEVENASKNWVAAALLFSLFGDLLLLKSGELLFLAGMGAFGLTHIFFIAFYFKNWSRLHPLFFLLSIIVGGAGIYTLYQFINAPQELSPYLYGYGGLLALHLILGVQFAAAYKGKTWQVPLGILLFMISDLLLAYNKFNIGGDKYWQIAVMLSYGMAQYLITIGLLNFFQKAEVPARAGD